MISENQGYNFGYTNIQDIRMSKIKNEQLAGFGERLRQLRLEKGFTQQELANEVNVSRRVIIYYERETDHPPSHLLPDFAKALSVSIDELMGLKAPKKKKTKPSTESPRLARRLKQIEKLSIYFENPLKSTILVINYKSKVDKRKKFFKDIKKQFVVFESSEIRSEKINTWVNEYLAEKGFSITQKATSMLVEFLGNSLSKIVNELDKLIILIADTKTITEDHIEENIGISKDFNIFELLNAIGQRNQYKSFFIANHFGQNPKEHPFVLTINFLSQYFSKILVYHSVKNKADKNTIASKMGINPYFLKDYSNSARLYPVPKLMENISILREYDMKSKGVNSIESNQGELLKELVFRLMN